MSSNQKPIESLVLDATPLLTQSASALQQYAVRFFTTPGVKAELRDENARTQLLLWGEQLVVRQPKQVFIDRVSAFAKLTGDYSVLSMNDIHIIALAYELEHEKSGDSNLRKFPGQKLGDEPENTKQSHGQFSAENAKSISDKEAEQSQKKSQSSGPEKTDSNPAEVGDKAKEVSSEASFKDSRPKDAENDQETSSLQDEDDGFQVVTRKHRIPAWKHRKMYHANRFAAQQASGAEKEPGQVPETIGRDITERAETEPKSESTSAPQEPEHVKQDVSEASESLADPEEHQTNESESNDPENGSDEDSSDEDDDGDWITPNNLHETMMKDETKTVRDAPSEIAQPIAVAITTGDFACQNVSMQIGLKLMNHMSGKQIRSVKNFMYRCHACFKMTPMPKSGERKHFCPKCGGDTLIRCAVSVDNVTGKITPHLKKNFKWITRGQVYSMASPLSKNTQKKQGNAGHQHNKENRHKDLQDPVILREDQREYADAIKEDAWRRRKSEKMLQEFVGGGSADNFISPFATSNRSSGVRVGRGRNANANRSKRK